ncbi:SDR family oxidoreductase [Luteolibacter flavescens]|uniref:SDR family oxidoreductase n=1 Tax=Luteolibacter flavescens TaxID=1859460 RepID=A0ABT3FN79_9BACT|nr:SDR family NAD(P)-dependent oxidoreductase [Luteolibacter flavescens]MCW1885024.1 SDR family oxidoreductase [Luteolibacter flavescens]
MSKEVSYNFDGKVALVTGGGSGIGKATATLLARSGARVAIIGRDPGELRSAAAEISPGDPGAVLCVSADVSESGEMEQAIAEIGEKLGGIDIVVANAGINGVWAPLEELEVDEWNTTIGINLRGTFLTVKLALPYLKRLGGSVIVVSSINGTRVFSNSGATAYSCSKAAQVAFCKMTALELAKDKIRVNAVCPGAIETNIEDSTERRSIEGLHLPVEYPAGDVPLTGGTPGHPDQVAQVIAFLASDASAHVTGTEIFIEGAQSLLLG